MTPTDYQHLQADISELLDARPGYRLRKLEVYNWGTFTRKVWTLVLNGESTLLTGDSGSGKSTLVDALATLLIAPRRIKYNKAADASAKERTLTTYVRGYYGGRTGDEGAARVNALRSFDTYAVLLATYRDAGLDKDLTIAIVYSFKDTAKPPDRFYVLCDQELSIARDFGLEGGDIAALKRRFKQRTLTEVFDDYSRYSLALCRRLGIELQALDLFQQTISMKQIGSLTSFIREHMLEDPDITGDIDKLISDFENLNAMHEAVLKAKRQIELLKPVDKAGRDLQTQLTQRDGLLHAREALPYWLAERKAALYRDERAAREHERALLLEEIKQANAQRSSCDDEILTVRSLLLERGGGALERLRREIEHTTTRLDEVQADQSRYEQAAQAVGLEVPQQATQFVANRTVLPALKAAEEETLATLRQQQDNTSVALASVRGERAAVGDELTSLRGRTSNIPRDLYEKRAQLCAALDIPTEHVPFVGELLEVKDSEQSWAGALERLLHSFGLSLLVDLDQYRAVSEWVDANHLGLRLVYYRVNTSKQYDMLSNPNAQSAAEKLTINPNTVFFGWLRHELTSRFSHVCCEDWDDFRRESFALTRAGQIKTHGTRHEKDDRHALDDQRRYILGFSNRKKIEALELNERDLLKRQQACEEDAARIHRDEEASQQRRAALAHLEDVDDFARIDAPTTRRTLQSLQDQLHTLEQDHELDSLQRRIKGLEATKQELDTAYNLLQRQQGALDTKIDDLIASLEDADKTVALCPPNLRDSAFGLLEEGLGKAGEVQTWSLSNVSAHERAVRQWLEAGLEKCGERVERLQTRIVKFMGEFRAAWPEDTAEMVAEVESLDEYSRLLAQLAKDDLPSHEKRFKESLNEHTINGIALFRDRLQHEHGLIRQRLELINGSLGDIDYNEGRFIRLQCRDTAEADVQDFKKQLRACTEDALHIREDEQYAESKFLQVKAIIERFKGRVGEAERDAQWRRKVTDVRNWLEFTASERWRETDEEYEFYRDSGGKSGGQKEKLAYTILAASLVYHYGLSAEELHRHSFRLVVIDEAFLKSSDESARYALELFTGLDLQLMVVTPLLKIPVIENYVKQVGFVAQDDRTHESQLNNITIEEYRSEREIREAARRVRMD